MKRVERNSVSLKLLQINSKFINAIQRIVLQFEFLHSLHSYGRKIALQFNLLFFHSGKKESKFLLIIIFKSK